MIEFHKGQRKEISAQQMEDIYALLKTPYKYGAVIKVDALSHWQPANLSRIVT